MPETKKTEEEILKFWKEKKIYEKSKEKNAKGKKFYLMDGPPYATGHIHMGTALNKILKDIAMRSQRMQGKNVFDRAGYDTHGVPIEFQIEKEIKSKSKKDIEKFGVKKFIGKCKEFATRFIGVMNSEFENLGVWMDFQNPYLTLDKEYVESIWDCFKIADKKELLYLGQYPVHVCPRCETAVAYNEIEYSKQEDNSIYVKFPLKGKENTYLIIWTTTPWTLPGNTGVMVNPKFEYQEVKLSNGEKWIIAKELVQKIMTELELGYSVEKEYSGKELEGWKYENPLSNNLNLKTKDAYRVVLSSRYVNLEEGTGLVHCAPGHGKEDYEVGKEAGIDILCPVGIDGLLTKESGKYAGKKARVVDSEIIEDLKKQGFLVHQVRYTHDYPLCWRCKSPLLMVSLPQWFLRISKIHKKILQENEKTNWAPPWMKLRMNAWLEGISDWPVSRKRYWGTPLPIWICEKCSEKKVVGSISELEKLSGKKVKEVHKPEIDEVFLKCKCGGKMKRVEEVLDVWFDSGVSSWAALNSTNKKFWPADLNIEGKDQVRGWWNSQLILSEIKFNKKPFENILVHGMVLDLGKKKMSKSLGNIVSPHEIIAKYGRDYMRYYFAKVSKGEDFAFDEGEFKEIQKVFRVLVNLNSFINQIDKKGEEKQCIEDKWILSRFNSMIERVVKDYNEFRFPDVVKEIEDFLVSEVSRTYIQMIRERGGEVQEVLNQIRIGVVKLLAPIAPFVSEEIWQELRKEKIVKEESVHLAGFPTLNLGKINNKLEHDFSILLKIIEAGLAVRNEKGVGLKWPLAEAVIYLPSIRDSDKFEEILKSQLNLKKVEFKKDAYKFEHDRFIDLDTEMTPELEQEGYAREIARKVQALRKKAGLVKSDRIDLVIESDLDLSEHEEFIKNRTGAEKIIISKDKIKGFKTQSEEKIKEKKVWLSLRKL